MGKVLHNIGDINYDDRDDMLLGYYSDDTFLYYGGITGEKDYYTMGVEEGFTCTSATNAGSFITVSEFGRNEWLCGNITPGAVRAFEGIGETAVATLTQEATYDRVGTSVAVGDVDGDGTDDVWVGAYGHDTGGSDAGAAYLVYGPLTGTFRLSGADAKVTGTGASRLLGARVLVPGDVDGDGRDDVLIGAAGVASGSASGAGAVYVVTDAPSGPAATVAHAVFYGEAAGDAVGEDPFDAGDFDGDGVLDLVAGSHHHSASADEAGAVWLAYGPLSGTIPYDARWDGTNASDDLGRSVVALPDTDGDGKDEIAMGAPDGDERGFVGHGAVWIWRPE